jgi:hypothetical protein
MSAGAASVDGDPFPFGSYEERTVRDLCAGCRQLQNEGLTNGIV